MLVSLKYSELCQVPGQHLATSIGSCKNYYYLLLSKKETKGYYFDLAPKNNTVNSVDIARLGWNIRPRGLRLKESLPKEKNLFRLTLAWEGKIQGKKKKAPLCQ